INLIPNFSRSKAVRRPSSAVYIVGNRLEPTILTPFCDRSPDAMPIKITCAGCKTVFTLPDSVRGKKGRCKKCGGDLDASAFPPLLSEAPEPAIVAAPMPAPTVPRIAPEAPNGRRTGARPPSSGGSNTALYVVVGVVGVVVLCCAGVVGGVAYLWNRA